MKVAVVTGTRAEYGLLAPLLQKIKASPSMELRLVVTGTHLLEEFGRTIDNIVDDGFVIDRTVPELSTAETRADVARQVGMGTAAFTDALEELSPNVLVLLGDRYEVFAAASAAFFLDIPILHLHGGEVTVGAFDDAVRHSISKFAKLHAVAAPAYAQRLIRMGEQPGSVHVVGGFGVDSLSSIQMRPRFELELELGFRLGFPSFLVTYHPVTAAPHETENEITGLLDALESYPSASIVFTLPNADPEHTVITEAVTRRVEMNPNWHLFSSLGSEIYLSLMSTSSVIVGNSSSGILEAPSLGVPTVNIGPRQDGRLMAESVISCGATADEIRRALDRALGADFLQVAEKAENPYGSAGASDRVMGILENTDFDNLGAKTFFDTIE